MRELQIAGPVLLIGTLVLAGSYDLALVAMVGLFLCSKWQLRGCAYSLVILGLYVCIKHFTLTGHHAWQLGLESSVACALVVSALVFEQGAALFSSLTQQTEAHAKTIQYLEEDLTKHKETVVLENTAALEKLSALNQQLEEVHTELSSYQILNEVLRKSTAKALQEKENLSGQLIQSERDRAQLLSEIDSLQTELARISNQERIVQQNAQLFKELNEARVQNEQTHLVNETVVRMHALENQKVKELEAKYEESLSKITNGRAELEMGQRHIDHLTQQLQSLEKTNKNIVDIQTERNFLAERLGTLEADLERKRLLIGEYQAAAPVLSVERENELIGQIQKIHAEKEMLEAEIKSACAERENHLERLAAAQSLQRELEEVTTERQTLLELFSEKQSAEAEQVKTLQKRLEQFAQMELLYRQLKEQYEERNQVLHQARVQLFHTDTELQTVKIELQEKKLETDPMPPRMAAEIEGMEQEKKSLEEENRMLQDLVTHLMAADEVKKKIVKKRISAEEQGDLFT